MNTNGRTAYGNKAFRGTQRQRGRQYERRSAAATPVKCFYLFKLSYWLKKDMEKQILALGGRVVRSLEAANHFVFEPTQKMTDGDTFFLGTAAVAGLHLITREYVAQSFFSGRFIQVEQFSSAQFYMKDGRRLYPLTMAAIKLSEKQRLKAGSPRCFENKRVLVHGFRGENDDINLFLRVAGALVHESYDYHPPVNCSFNYVVSTTPGFCVKEARTVTPARIRGILMQTLYNQLNNL